jgi:hypothetical protein
MSCVRYLGRYDTEVKQTTSRNSGRIEAWKSSYADCKDRRRGRKRWVIPHLI